MFHTLAHLVHIFKGRKKEKDEKEPKVENETPKDVKMHRQYGANVLDFSSQYSSNDSRSYAACNIAGPPSSFPNYGDFVKSFVLRTYGKWWIIAPSAQSKFKRISKSAIMLESNDFVDILYEEPVIPTNIHVLETYHPGSIIRILALQTNSNCYDATCGKTGRWVTLWSGPIQMRPAVSQNFAPPLQKTDKPIYIIRLEFNHEHLDYYTEVDAVEMRGNIVTADDKPLLQQHHDGEDIDTKVTTKLMKQLSINEEVQTNEFSSDNGFFDVLPSEIVHLIFLYLQLEDIFRAAATCRLFFRHCYDQIWFKELDLKPYWSKTNDMALQGLRNRCIDTVKLNLSWCGPYGAISPLGFKQFLENSCQKLVCLRLSACNFVDDSALCSIAKCCSQLQELDLSSCMLATDQGFKHLMVLKKLTRLNFYRVKIRDSTLLGILWSCSHCLKHLNIGACSFIHDCDDIVLYLKDNCRSLVSLDLWRNSSLSSAGLHQLAAGCPLLEELEIGWCSDVICSTGCVQDFVKTHPKLKKLFMAAIRSISNEDVLAVAEHCPDIEQLDILGTSLVGPRAIRKFMAKRPQLLFFDVSFCSQIRKGFVNEMRTMYPKTSFKKSFTTDQDDGCDEHNDDDDNS